jgi:hypothetical protein
MEINEVSESNKQENSKVIDLDKQLKNQYNMMFAENLEKHKACPIVKHKMTTNECYPMAIRDSTLPIHMDKKIEE